MCNNNHIFAGSDEKCQQCKLLFKTHNFINVCNAIILNARNAIISINTPQNILFLTRMVKIIRIKKIKLRIYFRKA